MSAQAKCKLGIAAAAKALYPNCPCRPWSVVALLLRATQPLAGLASTVVIPGQRVALWAVNVRPGEVVRVYATRLAVRPLFTGVADRKGHGYWPLAVPYASAGKNQMVVIGSAVRPQSVAHSAIRVIPLC